VVKKFGEDNGGQLAGLIAYYAFFSLFPAAARPGDGCSACCSAAIRICKYQDRPLLARVVSDHRHHDRESTCRR